MDDAQADNDAVLSEDVLSDDELAALEREIEAGNSASGRIASRQTAEHRSAFEMIDELSAPIRMAIDSFNSPPMIEGYGELTEMARGGMGVVYRGLHRKTQRYDAVKVMRPDRIAGASNETASLLRLQFLRECQLAARVAHEHIVPVYQVGETGERPWYSMQLVDGLSLHELTRDSLPSAERVVRYIEQIAGAVDVVHRHGILHGDIKPQNILIEIKTDRPMLSDFGLAGLDASVTGDGEAGIAGTPAYMAPELARAAIHGGMQDTVSATRTVSADVYSLGATLWAALSGCSPCREDRTQQEQLADVAAGRLRFHDHGTSKIAPALMRIIDRCVAGVPESRFSTAGDLAEALSSWLDRPRWNRHFPRLRQLLCIVVAPVILMSGVSVQYMLATDVAEHWIWMVLFAGYVPLFATFRASQRTGHGARQAHRELWSIWAGHFCASLSGSLAFHILCHPETDRLFELYYPFWAALSALVFFAKSGNFWASYRWFGVAWSLIAVVLALTVWAPILFGALAAITCIVIAQVDRAFLDD